MIGNHRWPDDYSTNLKTKLLVNFCTVYICRTLFCCEWFYMHFIRCVTMNNQWISDAHIHDMMTSSNGNIFRVTGHLCGEFTGQREIPRTKAIDAELWCFILSTPECRLREQSWGWWFETPLRPLRRHCNVWFSQWVVVFSRESNSK